jgi:RNA polymerase sigma factor (sigma-70 family)
MPQDIPHCEIDTPAGVDRLKQRDQQAWELLLEAYSIPLRRDITASLVKRGLPEQSLHDILQETWLVAIGQIECFVWRKEHALYHWLRVIALNRIRKRVQKAQREGKPFGSAALPLSIHDSSSALDRFLVQTALVDDPENRLSLQQDLNAVMDTIHEASARDQEIITRWLLGEEKPQELASLLGMKPATVSQIVWRFVKRTRSLLKSPE